jgi:hypothetical protein
MDALSKQQTHEILNYDRNINLRALALQRKQVANLGTDGGETGELLNQDVIDASNSLVNSFFVLLDKRRADMNIISRWAFSGNDKAYGDAINGLGRISEVVDAYNQLVSTYMSSNTTQTKGIILSSIRRMLDYVSEIRGEVSNHMQHYLKCNTRATRKTTLPSEYYITKYLHDIVVALVAYDVIEEQSTIGNSFCHILH